MPMTVRGNNWILVLTDHFTRWANVLAIPDALAPQWPELWISRYFVIWLAQTDTL